MQISSIVCTRAAFGWNRTKWYHMIVCRPHYTHCDRFHWLVLQEGAPWVPCYGGNQPQRRLAPEEDFPLCRERYTSVVTYIWTYFIRVTGQANSWKRRIDVYFWHVEPASTRLRVSHVFTEEVFVYLWTKNLIQLCAHFPVSERNINTVACIVLEHWIERFMLKYMYERVQYSHSCTGVGNI